MPGNLVNVDVGKLAKPATALIEKVSDAVGGIARPSQIRRVASAEADAKVILAEADIKITELQQRAARRFIEEETKNQTNIERITHQAIPHLNEDSEPDKIEDDFLRNFFDKCRTISDQQMQDIWARILAGEANLPGTFSRKTVNILSDMDKSDAELFTTLCSFAWRFPNDTVPLVFTRDEFFKDQGIALSSLADIESLGLILTDSLGYVLNAGLGPIQTSYFGLRLELTLAPGAKGQLQTGDVLLTAAGRQIGSICELSPIEGFFEFMREKWEQDPRVEAVRLLE